MRFLIIDDDDYKVEKFTKHLNENDSFNVRKSFNSGLRELINNKENYDCLILDMNFPHFDNESVKSNEGLKVLNEIKRKNIDIPVVIYSSKCVDVSDYENVKYYLIFSAIYDIEDKVNKLKDILHSCPKQ